MVQFNFSERTIKAKVVYYGPPQSGKTTNLEQIHRISDPEGANRLISLNTAQDRTLFFDLLPFSLGTRVRVRLQDPALHRARPGAVQRHAPRGAGGGRRRRFRGRRPPPDGQGEPGRLREHEGEPAREPPGSREGPARVPVQQAGPRAPDPAGGARPHPQLLGPQGVSGGRRARRRGDGDVRARSFRTCSRRSRSSTT